jgi:hypothetical protein
VVSLYFSVSAQLFACDQTSRRKDFFERVKAWERDMDMTRRGFLATGTVCAFSLIAGCGGGGGGNNGDSNIDDTPPASVLRTYQNGDRWTYALSATVITGPSSSTTYNGSLESSIASTTFQNTPAVSQTITTTLAGEASTESAIFRQDSVSRNLVALGSQNGTAYTPPVIALPGQWSTDADYVNSRADVRYTFDVVGTNTAEYDGKKIRVWRVNATRSGPDFSSDGIYYYAPTLGTYVQAQYEVRFLSGDLQGRVIRYRAVLQSTNTD